MEFKYHKRTCARFIFRKTTYLIDALVLLHDDISHSVKPALLAAVQWFKDSHSEIIVRIAKA